MTKFCHGCQATKEASEFGKHKGRHDGLRHRCKECTRVDETATRAKDPERGYKRTNAWRVRNPDKVISYARDYREKNSQAVKDSQNAHRKANPERERKKNVRYNATKYAKDPEKSRARSKTWKKDNPDKVYIHNSVRRARKMAALGSHTAADIEDIRNTQRNKCAHPWCRVDLLSRFHRDHIVPLVLGGSNEKKNIQLLCQTCNLRKNKQHPVDFALRNGMLV